MLLMTAFSTIVSGSAAQMQDLTATVDPSQSSLDACLTAIDITDCQSGAINGSLEFGIDQSTGDVKTTISVSRWVKSIGHSTLVFLRG